MSTATALIVPVPEAEPVVGVWRDRYDPAAAEGVPAHVTVLYPFLPRELADPVALRELFAGRAAFDVEFRGFGHFPEVLYLAPEPGGPFRELTEAVAGRWPEAPPYGGAFPDIVPHLTVADGMPARVREEMAAAIADGLPVRTRVRAVELWVRDDTARWHPMDSFPLAVTPS